MRGTCTPNVRPRRCASHLVHEVEGGHGGLQLVELIAVLHGGQRVRLALLEVAEELGLGAARNLQLQRVRQLRVQLRRRQQLWGDGTRARASGGARMAQVGSLERAADKRA